MSDISNTTILQNLDLSSEYCNNCNLVKCVALCIDKACNCNGPICYNCLYSKHIAHCTNCIPIQRIKIEHLETSSFKDYIKVYKNFIDKTNSEIQIIMNDQKRLLNDLDSISTNSFSFITSLNLWKSLVCNNDFYILSTKLIKEAIEFKIQKSFEGVRLKLSKIFNYDEYKKFIYEQEYEKGIFYIHNDINKPGNLLYSENATGDILHFSINRDDIVLNGVCICRPATISNTKEILEQSYLKVLDETNNITNEIVTKKFQSEKKNSILKNFSDEKAHLLIKFDIPIQLKRDRIYSIKVVNYYKGSYYLQSKEEKKDLNENNFFTIKECPSENKFIIDNNNTFGEQYSIFNPPQSNPSLFEAPKVSSFFGTSSSSLFRKNNAECSLFGGNNIQKEVETKPFENPLPKATLFGQPLPVNTTTNPFSSNTHKKYISLQYPYSGMIAYIDYSFKK